MVGGRASFDSTAMISNQHCSDDDIPNNTHNEAVQWHCTHTHHLLKFQSIKVEMLLNLLSTFGSKSRSAILAQQTAHQLKQPFRGI
jgi:hypothetical protein